MSVDVDSVRTIDTPTQLVHGPGALARLGELVAGLGVSRPLLVTDPGVVAAGLADRALEQLGDDVVVFAEVKPNPDIELVDEVAALYEREGCDGLVAAGGGSPMDEGLGFSEDEVSLLARISLEDPQTIGNPREPTLSDYEGIWRGAFARGR